MLNDFHADKVYIACGYTDLRRGIDGLASIVESQFHLDPFSRTLFLFCGKRSDRIKALYFEGDGFVLLYKRLENGSFQWPRNETEARAITPQQFRLVGETSAKPNFRRFLWNLRWKVSASTSPRHTSR